MGVCASKANNVQPPVSRLPGNSVPPRPPPAPVPPAPWNCAICTFYNEARATVKCAMCDQPKQVAQLQRAVSFSSLQEMSNHLTHKKGEYGKLATSAVSVATIAINEQKQDGILAIPPTEILRSNSLADDAGDGMPGDDKPLSQILRQQSLQIRFVNNERKLSSEGDDTGSRTRVVHGRSDSWQRKQKSDGSIVWLKPGDCRRVHPAVSDDGQQPNTTSNRKNGGGNTSSRYEVEENHGARASSTSWVRALTGKGELQWLPAKDVKDIELMSPASCGGVNSDLQYVASLHFEKKRVWFREACKSLQVPWAQGHIELFVNRENDRQAVMSSLEQVMQLSQRDMWKIFKVKFFNEDADDAGGVSREWFTTISRLLFSNKFGLFCRSGEGDLTYQINPHSSTALGVEHLKYFKFVGRLLGKALLTDIIVDAHFVLPIYKSLLGLPIILTDMQYVDDGLYEKIKWLQTHSIADLNDDGSSTSMESKVSDTAKPPGPRPKRKKGQNAKEYMKVIQQWNVANAAYLRHKNQQHGSASNNDGLTFVYETNVFGERQVHELKKNGGTINVTDRNKNMYIQLLTKYRMLDATKSQTEQLLIGFYEVIPPMLVSIFTFQELELLLCGLPYIDVDDWEKSTQYSTRGCLKKNHEVSKWFWQIIRDEFTDEQRARLLQFSTGSANVPVGGFKELQTHSGNTCPYTILGVPVSQKKYPSAHTCFNRLELPMYATKRELRQNLMVSIEMEMRLDLE